MASLVGIRSVLLTLTVLLLQLPQQLVGEEVSAASIAALVDHHYNSLHSLQVHFVQQFDGLGQNRKESGTLLLKKPGRMRWSYDQPAGKLFVLDGRNAYFYTPGHQEVQRIPAKKLDDLQSPLRFLLGHSDLVHELRGMQGAHVGENYTLTGVPRHLSERVSSLRLLVSSSGTILQIEVDEVDDSASTFQFSGEITNPPADESDFSFQAPAGSQIIDGMPPA